MLRADMNKFFFNFVACAFLILVCGSSCSTKDNSSSAPNGLIPEGLQKCSKIFQKYLAETGQELSFEVVAIEENSCMVSEVIDKSASDAPSRRLSGNKIFVVDINTNEVRQFPMR
jgi:hypothetical protein